MNDTNIRILVVDDHTLFRRGLTALLARDRRLRVVGDAADAGEAQRRALELQPDLILLDNHLPGVHGVDALPALRVAAPQARVLLLTVSEDAQDLAAALRGGAAGYLLKTAEGDALIDAILRTMQGDSVIAPEMTPALVQAYRTLSGASPVAGPAVSVDAASAVLAGKDRSTPQEQSPLDCLSPRERDILRAIAAGASNKEIGRSLGIAETTVKIHVQHILRKLGVASRVSAAVMANAHGLH